MAGSVPISEVDGEFDDTTEC